MLGTSIITQESQVSSSSSSYYYCICILILLTHEPTWPGGVFRLTGKIDVCFLQDHTVSPNPKLYLAAVFIMFTYYCMAHFPCGD
jgi:hypothetical protein